MAENSQIIIEQHFGHEGLAVNLLRLLVRIGHEAVAHQDDLRILHAMRHGLLPKQVGLTIPGVHVQRERVSAPSRRIGSGALDGGFDLPAAPECRMRVLLIAAWASGMTSSN